MSRLRNEDGITMIELLMAVLVGLVVFATTVTAFAAFANQSRRSERQATAQDQARRAVDRMLVGLRSAMAAYNDPSQTPIYNLASNDLIYLAPGDGMNTTRNARGLVFTRYCLDTTTLTNEKLYVQTYIYDSSSGRTPPSTGNCPAGGAWATQRIVAENIVNMNQSPTVPLFTSKTDASGNVTDVLVNAVVDADTANPPAPIQLQSAVGLRNLNRTPTAVLACQASNGHAICDASASTDPDGQTLTFAWQQNGTALSETSYRLDQPSLTSGTTYTFTVTATDSGGLSSTASQSVTMP
jgi:hypothetical protein